MATEEFSHVLRQVRALQLDEQRRLLVELSQLVRQALEPRGIAKSGVLSSWMDWARACGTALIPTVISRRSDAGGMARAAQRSARRHRYGSRDLLH